MPRTARIKYDDCIYHIMIKSVGDILLFKDNNDKDKFLQLIKRYQYKLEFKIYAYCLMDNHGHILINSNGADISKIMHGINQSYAQYYNKKYKRTGHVFGDRFKSKIVKDDKYLLTLSAYIHNNVKDLKTWNEKIQNYPYSSLGVYLGLFKDRFQILDLNFILELFSVILSESSKSYLKFVSNVYDLDIENEIEFTNIKSEYRSELVNNKQNVTPDEVIDYVCGYLNIEKSKIYIKYNRSFINFKALVILLLSRYCNYKNKDICKLIGNITQSNISKLCMRGIDLIDKNFEYKKMIDNFNEKQII